jgi:hypothetical protein
VRYATRIAAGALAGVAVIAGVTACGIGDPYTHASATSGPRPASVAISSPAAAQNPGERPAPPPPSPQSQSPSSPAATPEQAIRQFALLYIDWTWRTLPTHLRQLAAVSVGAARLAEQQAAAAAGRDSEITATQVFNRGQVVSIAPSQALPDEWVIVTREQTGGNAQYAGLQPSWHVTLAKLTHVSSGYSISQWLPQN